MSFSVAGMEEERAAAAAAEEIRRLPAEVNWEMLDKSRFFVLGAGLFSGVSAALYPAVVVKTHLQVAPPPQAATATVKAILGRDGLRGFYRGFGASLAGTVPARALYMAALEATKSSVGSAAVRFGVSEPAASAVGGLRRRRRAGGVDPRRRHQPAAHGPDLHRLPLRRRRGRLQEDPRRRRRPRPVPRLRPLHHHLRAVQRGVVGVLRHGAALRVARRGRRPLRELPRPHGRAGRQRRRGRGRGGPGHHAAGHREDAPPGDGDGRGGGAADAGEHHAGAAQGGRVGRVLPRAGAEVGLHVALRRHHGHHLRAPEAALGQGGLLALDRSSSVVVRQVTQTKLASKRDGSVKVLPGLHVN